MGRCALHRHIMEELEPFANGVRRQRCSRPGCDWELWLFPDESRLEELESCGDQAPEVSLAPSVSNQSGRLSSSGELHCGNKFWDPRFRSYYI